jgi:hypothetical protein
MQTTRCDCIGGGVPCVAFGLAIFTIHRSMVRTKVGTCGFGLAQVEYSRVFSCVEVQHIFYQPPQVSTLERWRARMPAYFEFTLKAWQLITHDAKSLPIDG